MPSFNGSGAGPVYGHAASKDLAHWARLPVAIWNDHRYDSVAIYTGVCQPDIHTPTDCCSARVDWC
jgi:sucrose-6-phosphate hydrolase SacC (GH32 family)